MNIRTLEINSLKKSILAGNMLPPDKKQKVQHIIDSAKRRLKELEKETP